MSALGVDFANYEDTVLHEAARAIVTRDRRGFSHATLPVLDPIELRAMAAARGA